MFHILALRQPARTPLHTVGVVFSVLQLALLSGCGGSDSSIPPPPPPASIELFAGTTEAPPDPNSGGRPCCIVDGRGSNAVFAALGLMAADSAGTLYVSDGSQWIRKVTPAADVTTLAQMDGGSTGIATDGVNVFAGEWFLPCISPPISGPGSPGCPAFQDKLWKIAPDGTRTRVADVYHAFGITRDASGSIWWVDNNGMHRIAPSGEIKTIPTSANFNNLWGGIAVDGAGTAYVASGINHVIYRINAAGETSLLAGSVGVPGDADGTGSAARFNAPNGVKVDAFGNVYVADQLNNLIRKITPQGSVTTVAGTRGGQGFVQGPLPGVLVRPADMQIVGNDMYIDMYKGIAVIRNLP